MCAAATCVHRGFVFKLTLRLMAAFFLFCFVFCAFSRAGHGFISQKSKIEHCQKKSANRTHCSKSAATSVQGSLRMETVYLLQGRDLCEL